MNKINFCDKCNLCDNGKLVWGEGNLNADLFFIGEAPGADEAEVGKPFVGRCGKYFTTLLSECEIDRKDIYISNIVKHRPPDNRAPFFDEIQACQQYLIEEIREVKPKLIITLGKTSGNWWNRYHPFIINTYYPARKWLPLYHPSYLLRRRKTEPDKWKKALLDTIEEI